MVMTCVLFCDLKLQKGLKQEQRTKIRYVIFLFKYFPYITGYHRVWDGDVGLKTWQNGGCCSCIGVFWSAMVIFNVRKLTWFCTTLTAIPVGYWTILTKMIRRVCRTVMGELHIRRSTDRPGEGRGSLS